MSIYTTEEFALVTAARIALAELAAYDAETRAMKTGKAARLRGRGAITRKLNELPDWAIGEAQRVRKAEIFAESNGYGMEEAERLLKWANRPVEVAS
jgi:hypothetical protein